MTLPQDRNAREMDKFIEESTGHVVSMIQNINDRYIQALAYDGNGLVQYIGYAVPGSAKSLAEWQIRKLTYSGVNLTDVQFANGSIAFSNVWDNRASLSYS